MNKLIINYTPTGMLMQKSDTPHVPITPAEIIADVRAAVAIGISGVHLHARKPDGTPAWEKEIYEEIILGIRAFAPDLVISVSTSGRVFRSYEKRSDVLNLTGAAKPDMASLTLSSLNFNKTASINEPDMIVALLKKMNEQGIRPELEAFDSGMVNYSKYLITKGLLQPPFYYNAIVGNIACAQPNLLHTGVLVSDIPDGSLIAFGGIGRAQLPINAMAIAMGYGVRIGIEDNIWYDEARTRLATNLDFLARIHVIADAMGREVCSSTELRELLHLQPGHGLYGVKT